MSAVAVTDALARHFKERVAGTKQAYATGAGTQPALYGAITDTPVVVAQWEGAEVTPGSFERTTWTISADAYFQGADATKAYADYVTFVDNVRTSIRGNWTLFGAATQISRWSAGPPEDVPINNKPYVRVTFTFEILEAGAQTYTGA